MSPYSCSSFARKSWLFLRKESIWRDLTSLRQGGKSWSVQTTRLLATNAICAWYHIAIMTMLLSYRVIIHTGFINSALINMSNKVSIRVIKMSSAPSAGKLSKYECIPYENVQANDRYLWHGEVPASWWKLVDHSDHQRRKDFIGHSPWRKVGQRINRPDCKMNLISFELRDVH